MKNISLFFLLSLVFGFNAIAQTPKVELCESYNKETGKTSGLYKAWDIPKDGGYIYIVYNQDKTIKDKLTLDVQKKNKNGDFVSYDTKTFDNDAASSKKWAMYDYLFTEAGEYKISVRDNKNKILATTSTDIGFMKDKTDSDDDSDDDAKDTYYYENTSITFGDDVKNAEVIGERDTFKLKNGKVDLVALLYNDDALKCKSITVSIYNGKDYETLVDELTFTIESLDWNWVKLPISVKEKGNYVVDIYNNYDTFINSGYFTVE
ncbi:MAG: hypothetical protein R2739_00700 [Chitinophagales bacterium]|nr:hypothetical protein [Bacteroidota bacterium]